MEERREPTGGNFNGGFKEFICEEDFHDEEHPPHHQSNRHQVSMFTMSPGRSHRLAAVSLALLAAVLLIVDIGLGVHYNKLTDTHLTLDDTERISKELINLQDTYKTAVETMKDASKQLDSEMSRQTQTNWEFEHQTKRCNDYKSQMEKITKEIETSRSRLSMQNDGCKHCPAGWILMNSVCYYFSLKSNEIKTWKESRDFCQLQGGDLIIIDSQDKENLTVNFLINHQDASQLSTDFWIGLSDSEEEGTWKWLDGTFLVQGYWNDGEPTNLNDEDCAALYPRVNFFKAWNDVRCGVRRKWICEKAPESMS
ncbi:CD209 antigen-like protein E [Neolamprologus brichardi]|uniref:CD209 antigen-like protein E n=1 Tax=Neolamprologus brichardi TaxID=32507 RepID=UPI001643D54E|nr:CD209 antigen-like protein E [Neolamprologus brichardi]